MKCVTAWVNNADERCQTAQGLMIRSVLDWGLSPLIVNGTPRPLLSEMLMMARRLAGNAGWFMWLNSDCQITSLPEVASDSVVGIHRRESEGGAVCDGVDAYIIPVALWDELYAPDVPPLYVGATHVDWWLTRLAQRHKCYRRHIGLYHLSHPKSNASAGLDEYGRHNLAHFHAWAERNDISTAYE
jgi:hypothetical protein